MSDVPGPGGDRFDAVERLRRTPDGVRADETGRSEAGDGASKLVRLPHRPRRMTEDAGERRRKTWRSEGGSVFDPAPTRPVLRSELQCETGAWPVDLGPAWQHVPDEEPGGAEHGGSVIDLGAWRKRAGDAAPAVGIRRMAKPRRIGPDTP
ncbi:hypothetical protein [Nocardia transvalensis]|uniref:hypothetical protein n=1 Tax=Nocardia transvalensis TaxID=37333 RepID=UPI001895BAEE|nr:hypothetical protein [Nocardia transvalensis]MBF6331121.1 hypothetical protein [Nocardia transvalensis]